MKCGLLLLLVINDNFYHAESQKLSDLLLGLGQSFRAIPDLLFGNRSDKNRGHDHDQDHGPGYGYDDHHGGGYGNHRYPDHGGFDRDEHDRYHSGGYGPPNRPYPIQPGGYRPLDDQSGYNANEGNYQRPNQGDYQRPNNNQGGYQRPNNNQGDYQRPDSNEGGYQRPNNNQGGYLRPNKNNGGYDESSMDDSFNKPNKNSNRPDYNTGQYEGGNDYQNTDRPNSNNGDNLYPDLSDLINNRPNKPGPNPGNIGLPPKNGNLPNYDKDSKVGVNNPVEQTTQNEEEFQLDVRFKNDNPKTKDDGDTTTATTSGHTTRERHVFGATK